MKLWAAHKRTLVAGTMLAGFALGLTAEERGSAASGKAIESGNTQAASIISSRPVSQAIAKEINDPSSGTRWLLMPDPEHPGGPGRLVRAEDQSAKGEAAAEHVLPIIHSGDKLVVEEHSAVLDTRLEGVALGAARNGDTLRVRLKLNGTIVQATALAPGRVSMAPVTEASR